MITTRSCTVAFQTGEISQTEFRVKRTCWILERLNATWWLGKIERGDLSACIWMRGNWVDDVETRWSLKGLLTWDFNERILVAPPSLFLRRSIERVICRRWERVTASDWRGERSLVHMLPLEKEMRNDSRLSECTG